jgi:hypothetical protein
MRGCSAFRRAGSGFGGFGGQGGRGGRRASGSAASGSAGTQQPPRGGVSPVVKAMFVSASLSATGDLIAQARG